MQRTLSKIVSTVFIPFHIPTMAALLMVWSNPYAFGGWKMGFFFTGWIIIWTFLIPVISLLIMKKLNIIDSLGMNVRTERIAPYLLVISCYSIAFYAIFKLPIPDIVKAMVAGSLVSIIFSFFWNNFLKISAHANGMGTLLGICLGLLAISTRNVEWMIVGIILLSGCVLSARMFLKNHTLREVFFGFMVGFATQLIAFLLYGVF